MRTCRACPSEQALVDAHNGQRRVPAARVAQSLLVEQKSRAVGRIPSTSLNAATERIIPERSGRAFRNLRRESSRKCAAHDPLCPDRALCPISHVSEFDHNKSLKYATARWLRSRVRVIRFDGFSFREPSFFSAARAVLDVRAKAELREKWFIKRFAPCSWPQLPVDLLQGPEQPLCLTTRYPIVVVARNAADEYAVYNTDTLSRDTRRHNQRQVACHIRRQEQQHDCDDQRYA